MLRFMSPTTAVRMAELKEGSHWMNLRFIIEQRPACFFQKYDSGSVMVWDWFAATRPEQLIITQAMKSWIKSVNGTGRHQDICPWRLSWRENRTCNGNTMGTLIQSKSFRRTWSRWFVWGNRPTSPSRSCSVHTGLNAFQSSISFIFLPNLFD